MIRCSKAVGLVLVLIPLAGCGGSVPEEPVEQPPRLGDKIELSLAEMLGQPRADLAAHGDELLTKIQLQEKGRREGKVQFATLEHFRLPLNLPILRQAKFSSQLGVSIPPYVAEGVKDNELALHLARHGDVTAAHKFVEPNDAEALRQIDNLRYEREYPLEWSRMVALLMHEAQIKTALGGDLDGATELVHLHRQLKELLDPKAASGPLGAALLGRGRNTLVRAIAAWRAEKKDELVAQAEGYLAEWGESPAPAAVLHLGMTRQEACRHLDCSNKGKVLVAASPLRPLDLWSLPFPDEGIDAVLGAIESGDLLTDVYITYKPTSVEIYGEPAMLAHLFENRPGAGQDLPAAHGLRRRAYPWGDMVCQITVVNHGMGLGALIHLGRGGERPSGASFARDFGLVHLDRTFESNRLHIAPGQKGEVVRSNQPRVLEGITNPLTGVKPEQVSVQRLGNQNLAAGVTLTYPVRATGALPLHQLILDLWNRGGAPRIQGVTDSHGGYLALVWEDPKTRYTVRLPYEYDQPVQFEATDRQGEQDAAARETAAVARDSEERKARIQGGKTLARLGRQLEDLELGMTRAQVFQVLPAGTAVLKQETPDGLAITFAGDPAKSATHVARQLFVRFDGAGKVAEVRARYVDGPGAGRDNSTWRTGLLNALKKEGGPPQELPAPWAGIWPSEKPAPVFYRWLDDVTLVTYQRDRMGVEIARRDCPLDQEQGIGLSPLQYLARGPARCQLGMSKDEVLKAWNVTNPMMADDGSMVLRPQSGPHDAMLVYFDKGQVVRILARNTLAAPANSAAGQWAQTLTSAWTADLRSLSWPRREEMNVHDILQGLAWNDDMTRVRMAWREDDKGAIRIWTEWEALGAR